MDIRKWLCSPKSSPKVEGKRNKSPLKQATHLTSLKKDKQKGKKSKKRIIIDSESDEDPLPPKRKNRKHSDEEYVIETDSDAPSKSPKKRSQKEPMPAIKAVTQKLKPTTAADFFGNVPVERSDKCMPSKKSRKAHKNVENAHEDDDFEKTLLQLDEENKMTRNETHVEKHKEKKKLDGTRKGANTKKEKIIVNVSPPKKKDSLIHEISPKSENIKFIEEKMSEEEPAVKKQKSNFVSYKSFLEREGPKALGSKEIPEGEAGCLEKLTFVITGVLESMEREDAKSLIEKYGGKVMTTLSKNTKYIIVGRDAGPSKIKKAENFGTKQLDEDGLLDLIRTLPGKKAVVSDLKRKKLTPSKYKKTQFNQTQDCNSEFDKTSVQTLHSPRKRTFGTAPGIVTNAKKDPETLFEKENSTSDYVPKRSSNKDIFEMWVDKYKPLSLKQIIGQQGEKSNAKKLFQWLLCWKKNVGKVKKPVSSGKWNNQDNGSSFKAALLSGPPGIGKTTTAQLACKEAGFDYFELNASDARSKKNLQQAMTQLLGNQSLTNCFTTGSSGKVTDQHVIIMDEVDGMAGNEDRGGVQELIGLIKLSKIPIICICNDRNHPKIRSLSNYCFDLRFQRPRIEQIKAGMMSIAYRENIKISPNVLQDIILASNQDIRQVLHNLSLWTAKEKGLTADQAKCDIGKGTKNIKMGAFDVLREVFSSGGSSKKATIADKSDLFFHDYSIAPLFVQENYVHVQPHTTGGSKLKHLMLLSETANSICDGDLIDKQIRSASRWNLLPIQAIFASVVPGELMQGHLTQMINFPSWLGKNSTRSRMDRLLQELQMHMRMRITGNKTDVALEYLPLLRKVLTKPLIEYEGEGVKSVINVMGNYCLLREDFDSIIEMSLWPQQHDPRTKISSKVKAAFTRAYNKEGLQNPYQITNAKKKKGSTKRSETDLLIDEDNPISESEEEEDNNLENDAMIKVKKQISKKAVDDKEPSSSKKGGKTSASRGRSKK